MLEGVVSLYLGHSVTIIRSTVEQYSLNVALITCTNAQLLRIISASESFVHLSLGM